MKKRKPKIYDYMDYREFLKDFYEFKKQGPMGYSYRQFSMQCGFKSPNFLKLVSEGKRNLTAQSVVKIGHALKLSTASSVYFECLVAFNQESDDRKKNTLLNQLHKLLPQHKRRDLGKESVTYLSHWIYPVIRELAEQKQFKADPYWIARKLNLDIELKEISKALHFLLSEGFITPREGGGYQASDKLVLSSDEVKSLAVRNYHRQMLQQAEQVLEAIPLDKREFAALTVHLSDSKINELKAKLKAFRQDIHQWALENSHDEDCAVVQINMQMYPQTKGVSR